MRKMLIGLFAVAAAAVCGAADKYWTGAAGDGLLTTAHNWSDEVAPASGDSFHFDTPSETPVRVVFPEHRGSWYAIPKITGTKDYTLVMNKAFAGQTGDLSEFAGYIEVGRTLDASYSTALRFTSEKAATIHGLIQRGYFSNEGGYPISIDEFSGDGFTIFTSGRKAISFGSVLGSLTAFSLSSVGTVAVGAADSDIPSHARFVQLADAEPSFDIKGGGFSVDVLRTAATTTKLTKSGDATLTVKGLRLGNENMALQVNGGKVVFSRPVQPSADPQIAEGAFLHLDASLKDTFSFSDDDSMIVSEWRDCRAGATGKATVYGSKPPKRVEAVANGLAVVDFGGHRASDAGCLTFTDGGTACCQEGFLVMREKAAKSQSFFLGDTGTYDFIPAGNGELLKRTDGHPRVLGGAWAFDGETVIPWETSDGLSAGEFHVVRFSLGEPARASLLCADRGASNIGGWEMAEVVIYSTSLTDQQRVDTEAFLLNKWLAKEHPNVMKKNVVRNYSFGSGVDAVLATDDDVEISSLVGGVHLVKEGTGTVKTAVGAGYAEVAVSGGKLDASVSVEDGAFIHLDASVDSSIDKIDHPSDPDGHPGKYVHRWNDVRGNGRYARLDLDRERQPASFPDLFPKVVEGGLNNLTYVDCGAPVIGANHPGLYFSESCPDAREIFLVWKDNSTVPAEMCNAFPVNSANYCFHRGNSGQVGSSNSFNDNEDTLWLDDGFHPYKTTTPSEGWHVMSIIVDPATKKRGDCATADVMGLSCDRSGTRSGGISIAEALVFGQPLSEGQRAMLRAKLMKKWLKPETVVPAAEVSYDRVSVAAGATLKMNVDLMVGALDVGGTVETGVTVAEDGEIGVTVGRDGAFGTMVNGAVTLQATGTVRLQLADGVEKVKGGLYPILTSSTGEFSGDISGWTLTGDYQSVIKGRVRLVAKADGLYLELPKPGLVLMVR